MMRRQGWDVADDVADATTVAMNGYHCAESPVVEMPVLTEGVMRSPMLVCAFSTTVLLTVGTAACGVDPSGIDDSTMEVPAVVSSQWQGPYEACPLAPADLAAAACTYHPGSAVNAYCPGGECFKMNYGGEARLVAADELGVFPKTFFAWHEGATTPVGLNACLVRERGNKTRIDIPAELSRCVLRLTTAQHLYYWHFVSNPSNGCMGWAECKQY